MRVPHRSGAALLVCALACLAQAPAPQPAFAVADIHASKLTFGNQFRRGPDMRGGRYELRGATMADLVSIAWSVDPDKVVGGPSWLELDRFDIIAKAPPNSSVETLKPALQQLLAERFGLKVHPESKPLRTFALLPGKKPQLKAADGSGDHGCRPQTGNSSGGGRGGNIFMMNADGTDVSFALGPGMTIQYLCRNMTMAEFAAGLPDMFTNEIGRNPIVDRTGLTGRYNFDVKWSLSMIGPNANNGDRISIFDAMDKQLGLKLEAIENPTPVIVVDSVNRQPSANAPDIAERLNIPPAPTDFDVVAIKPADPERRGMFQRRVQLGGRVTLDGISVQELVLNAWNLTPQMLVNAPSWLASDRYDIAGKIGSPEELDLDDVWPICRKLLADRFALKAHMEDRPVDTWRLVSVKPKLKKADPNTRAHTENGVPPGTRDPRQSNPELTRYVWFQNTTMAEFADQLSRVAGGYIRTPVTNETGLEGGWDFALAFSPVGRTGGRGGRGGRAAVALDGGGGASGEAAEPTGAISLFEAIEKELGLKLEAVKRPLPVLVIDSIERKPTEN